MKSSKVLALTGALAAILISACGGKGSIPNQNPAPAASIAPYTGPAQLASFAWGKDLLKGSVLQGPANENGTVGMQVVVNQRDATGLVQYAHDVSDPNSGNYRHFLTPQQIADRFGATSSDYQAAAAYFKGYGIHVSGWPQRESLFVTGAVGAMERAFNTKFGIYASGNISFVAPIQAPHLTNAEPIAAVVGMVHAQLNRDYMLRPPNSQLRGYSPQQMQRAFDFSGAYTGGFSGTGVNVAIVGTGPISAQDVPYLGRIFNAPVATVTQVDVTDAGVTTGLGIGAPSPTPLPSPVSYPYSSGFQTPPPVTAPCNTSALPLTSCNPEDYEAQLDTESVAELAPGANVLFYLGYNPNDCYLQTGITQGNAQCPAGQGTPAEGIALADAEIQQIIADNSADIVSMSYGLGEPFGVAGYVSSNGYYTALGYGYGPVEMATMVAEGMSVFASSGDNGAYECGGLGAFYLGNPPCVSYPAGDPNVVSVGGVTAPLNGDGTLQTQFTAWGEQTSGGGNGMFGNDVGSGGGISVVFFAPSWQTAAGVTSMTGGYRGQPDISMMADPNTAPSTVMNAAFPGQVEVIPVGGTSLAAPQMAAMWALVVQACKSDATCASRGTGAHPYRLGDPAALFYSIYSNAKQYPATFFDVTYGANGANNAYGPSGVGYAAKQGYDLVTGVGVPLAGHLINTVLTNEGSKGAWNLP
ncbi:MAG TPA: S53 family peptidase [Candidatus Dormibacteraeota bacterium]|nr:S53 family peptidase [Candidatus Dormibacteraeota bacterium]